MSATTLFFVSGILLVFIVLIRYAELRRGKRYAARPRKQVDVITERCVVVMTDVAPRYVAHKTVQASTGVAHVSTATLLYCVRICERQLSRVVHRVRGKRDLQKRQASSYLQNISSHKHETNGDRQNGYYES